MPDVLASHQLSLTCGHSDSTNHASHHAPSSSPSLPTHIHTRTCTHTYTCTHVHAHTHTCIHMHVHTHVHAHTYMYMHTRTCTYTHLEACHWLSVALKTQLLNLTYVTLCILVPATYSALQTHWPCIPHLPPLTTGLLSRLLSWLRSPFPDHFPP